MSKFKNKSTFGGLTLKRYERETVVINRGEIVIEVVEIKGNQVALSFTASKEISILRGELVLNEPILPAERKP